jgi:hypothetical protein
MMRMAMALLWLMLQACSSHQVRCDDRLRPINSTPAAVSGAVR